MIIERPIKKIIYVIFYISLFLDVFAMPFPQLSLLRFAPDGLIILAMILSVKKNNTKKTPKLINMAFGIYSIVVVLSAIINLVPIHLFLWAVRNTFRFVIYFYLCIQNLNEKDIEKMIHTLIYPAQYFNFVVVLIQYFIFHCRGDYLGGIFGVIRGCNGALNVFLIVVTSFSICHYLSQSKNSSEKFKLGLNLVGVIVSNSLIAALAELKYFYFELVIILFLCLFLYHFSIKKIAVFGLIVCFGVVGIKLTEQIFPSFANFFTNTEVMVNYINHPGGKDDVSISRGSFYFQINDYWFKNSKTKQLFGLGFGAAEMSSNFEFLNSDFANQYGDYNYRWIGSAMLYLETGLLGLCSNIFIFLAVIIYTYFAMRKQKENYILKGVIIISFLLIVNTFYNITNRTDIAYLSYLVLSFAPILILNQKQDSSALNTSISCR